MKIRNAKYALLGVAFLLCLNSQGEVAADTGRCISQLDERLIAGKQIIANAESAKQSLELTGITG